MCSVSILEQEASQLNTVTATLVSATVTGSVKTSETPTIDVADDQNNAHNVET